LERFAFAFKPSVAELAEQAEKAASPENRLRYMSIMELIEREIPMLVHGADLDEWETRPEACATSGENAMRGGYGALAQTS
jgi:hypothetical protein